MFNNHATVATQARAEVVRAYQVRSQIQARKEKRAKTIILGCGALMWGLIVYVVAGTAWDWMLS